MCMPTMECYSAIRRNEVVMYAATWMDLENILSEIHQAQTAKCSSTYVRCLG